MSHKHGTYLGGVRSIACVRSRCAVDEETGCWRHRKANGRPHVPGATPRLTIGGRSQSAARVVWSLARKVEPVPHGMRTVRTCRQHDCLNPAHIEAMTESQAQAWLVGSGALLSAARRANITRIGHARRKLSPEQVSEIRGSDETAASLARRFAISHQRISAVRNGTAYRDVLSGASVFAWGGA